MTWEVELAKEFKQRDNQSAIGNIVGNIISLSPIKISALDGDAILQAKHLYATSSIISRISSGDISVGTSVLLMHDSKQSKWFVIDTIVKL